MERQSLAQGKSSELEVYVEVHNRQGLMLADDRRYDEAIACYDRVLLLKDDHVPALYGRGAALANMGQYQAALSSFDRAIAIAPSNYAVWTFRAVVLIHLKQYQHALSSCERALALQPDDWEALTFRGVAFYHLGQYKRAYESYERATGHIVQRQRRWEPLTNWLRMLLQLYRRKQAKGLG